LRVDNRRKTRIVLPPLESRLNTRAKAIAAGHLYYFPQEPCKRGHISARAVSNYQCIECRREDGRNLPPEVNAKRQQGYRERHPDRAKASQRASYEKNADYYRNSAIAWRLENPDLARQIDRNKKARRKGAEGRHTADQIADLAVKQRFKCIGCSGSIKNEYHVDHIVPLVAGGSNDISNIQLLCPTCNLRKHAKMPLEWARELGRLL